MRTEIAGHVLLLHCGMSAAASCSAHGTAWEKSVLLHDHSERFHIRFEIKAINRGSEYTGSPKLSLYRSVPHVSIRSKSPYRL